MEDLKKTPLYELYQKSGTKLINFGGWALPVHFSSIKGEHEAVRTRAGLFDVSHMGEIEVTGKDSLAFLQKVMTNDVSVLKTGRAQYTAMCYENGGTVDDLLIYKMKDDKYMLVVNAANTDKDFDWLKMHQEGDVSLVNISSKLALLALQGPLSVKVIQKLTTEALADMKFFSFKEDVDLKGTRVLVSRTGYTGEDGYEIYCQVEEAPKLWQDILEAGKEEKVLPCGLGARDTLRFEAALPLYGQELSETITPIEAGVGFAVNTNKDDFIGKSVLNEQKENGAARKIVGIEMIDRGIPRHGYKVLIKDEKIGEITSGTQSPTFKKNIGLALVKSEYAAIGTEIKVQIRQNQLRARVVSIPFYKRSK